MSQDNNANPELLGFLKEWYDQAKEHNTKGASTYKRAYESMKACPVTFDHPSQAIQLNGLGPKLCERLTKRLEEYCLQNNKPMPQVPKRNSRKRNTIYVNANDDGDDDGNPAPAPPPNPKRPRRTKEYVPTYRSGAYGLLIALYEAGEETLTKEQLIEMAQPHSDASFTVPSDTTKRYTAWGSMTTLIEKNLVYGRGRPKRFWLTEVGDEVAKATVEANDPYYVNGSSEGGNMRNGNADISGEPSSRSRTQRAPAKATAVGKRLRENQAPRRLGGGAVRVTNDDEDYRRIAVRANASRQQSSESSRSADLVAQRNRLQALYSGRPAEYGKEPRSAPRGKPPLSFIDEDLTDSSPPPSHTPILRTLCKPSSNVQLLPPMPRISSINKSQTSFPTARELSVLGSQPQKPGPPTHSQSRQPAAPVFPPFVPDVLEAGTFTIYLLLDNREVRAKNDRDYISNNLADAGVTPIVRALQVGDAIWIARENNGREREVVLDYIVERKRLDDLVSSIKDGRFHDQKFRLKKSGVKNVVYIIEDFSMGNMDGPMQESIETAISSTQVVNGFFVKKTNKLDDTIRYLVRMTKMLADFYRAKDLKLIPESLVDSKTYQALLTHLSTTFPGESYYTTYTTFSSLVSKSGTLTLRDVYIKMLMCVRGVNVEKALEIQRYYPTPRGLVDAYERCDGDNEKKDLIVKACSGAVGRKRVSAALSSKISEVWAGVAFEDDGR